jgi:carboxypeptidase C (cathepsin A)
MLLDPQLQQNVSFRYYQSGHMVYLNPATLSQMRDDVAAWMRQAVSTAASGEPAAMPEPRRRRR